MNQINKELSTALFLDDNGNKEVFIYLFIY